MESAIIKEIGRKLMSASRVLITSHIRPDGDALGSVLGLGLALESKGKSVQMVLKDGVADILNICPDMRRSSENQQGSLIASLPWIAPIKRGWGVLWANARLTLI